MSDINAEIDRELAIAKANWGSRNFELLCLEGSRGDTLNDEDLLRRLRYFNRHGTGYLKIRADARPSLWQRLKLRVLALAERLLITTR